jgi:predicted DNA-binding transcriptional regulator AlpA
MIESALNNQPRFVRLDHVANQTGLGKSTILAWEAAGRFPKAVRLSTTLRVWLESDVNEWVVSKAKG